MSDFSQMIHERYSVRGFSGQPVTDGELQAILEAAHVAPTAHNNQPQRIKVLSTPEELALVDGFTPCRYGAPLVFVVCYDRDVVWVHPQDGRASGDVDASIVTTHMMLAAQDLGLGSVWVMFFDQAGASEALGLPNNIVPVAVLPVGHPAADATPSDFHDSRVPLEQILL